MRILVILTCIISTFGFMHGQVGNTGHTGETAYKNLNLPDLAGAQHSGQVIIAVIDDGFLLSHKSFRDLIWKNDDEIPGNGVDDDGNGFIDDYTGWDAADEDPDVTMLPELKESYYHGTMIASIIALTAKRSLGENAGDHIKIMPIKALADDAPNTSMHKGYQGLQYAIDNKADIICLAWSGGEMDKKYVSLFNRASAEGILMLGAAGNFDTDDIKPPASIPNVYAVAALDSTFKKIRRSNYGQEVVISTFGDDVLAAYPTAENAYFSGIGTSSAVALATGAAAILKLENTRAKPHEIMGALINTAIPVESLNGSYNGRLGAGYPDVTAAVSYLENPNSRGRFFLSNRPEGEIHISKNHPQRTWELHSSTATEKYMITLSSARKSAGKGVLSIYSEGELFYELAVRDMKLQIEVPGNQTTIEFKGKVKKKKPITLLYESIPIDSIRMFCTEQLLTEPSGSFNDGSGDQPYNNRQACKWLIRVTPGKNIELDFTEFDTELDVDHVWIFQGTTTVQQDLVAKFSGQELPPILTLNSNEALVWFVTDQAVTKDGWSLNYREVLTEPGTRPRD